MSMATAWILAREARSRLQNAPGPGCFALPHEDHGPAFQIEYDRQIAVMLADRDLVDGQLSQFLQLDLLESPLQIGLLDFLDQSQPRQWSATS